MTVKISVGASVDPAISALKRIDAASRDAARGNKILADSIEKVNQQLEEAKKISPGFRESLKNTGQLNKSINNIDWGKLSTNPRVAANQRTKIVGYATAGTMFEPKGSSGGDGSSGAFGKNSGGGMPSLPIPGMIKGILALAGIGGLASTAYKATALATSNAINVDNLVRASDSMVNEFETVSNEVASIGVGFGIAKVEAGKLAKMFSELSGETKTAIVAENTRNALALSKGFGMNTDSTVRGMGKLQFMMGGKMQQKELGMVIANGIISGGMFAKGDEVLAALERYVESSERVLVQPPDVAAYAALKAAMDSSSAPGLRGRGGESALGAIDNGIRNPGAGEAGEYFMYRAIGQGLSVPKFKYLKEAGMLGSLANQFKGETDTEFNLTKTMRRFKLEQPDPYARAMGESNVLGITMHQAMAFEDIYDTFKPNERSKFFQAAKDANVDLKNVSPGVYKDLGVVANSKAPKNDIVAKMKEIASENLLGTKGSDTENIMAAYKDGMNALGDRLIVPLNSIKDGATGLLDAFKMVYADELEKNSPYIIEGTRKSRRAINRDPDDFLNDLVGPSIKHGSRKSRRMTIEPLEVIHKNEAGRVIGKQNLSISEGVTNPQ